MRTLFVGLPLYGLLYPVLFLAQAFHANGHEVLIASEGQFTQKAVEAGLVVFGAAPGLDSEAGYRHHEAQRKKSNVGTQMGNFSFLSEEMVNHPVEFAGYWRPDLIIYPPLGVIGPLIAARYDIPVVMQTVGFGHAPWHIKDVMRPLADAYRCHNVGATPRGTAWVDITPPSTSIPENDGEPIIPMQYAPYNGGAMWEPWWEGRPERKRLLVSLGTAKLMVDGLDLIAWVMDSASEVDAEIILHISVNVRFDLRPLPPNVRLVDWIPMGVLSNGVDGFIHHGGAGSTLTVLYAGIPQIVLGRGADRPVNARVVAEHGCGTTPGGVGLSSNMINAFLNNRPLRKAPKEVAAEMAAQPCSDEVAKSLITMVQKE